jgi:hypothetical protein
MRCIATHTREGSTEGFSVKESEEYYKYSNAKKFGATFLDLAIGSRVRCTENLCTEAGNP